MLSGEFVDEWEKFNAKNELDIVSKLEKPIKIIAAKKGILLKGSRAYYKAAKEPKELTIINGATHCFDEEGTETELLKETLSWIKKYSK
ncbi:MAG: hypothetical protein H6779_03495 [Candidatus Nomurabacteria bacterium]|nr:hypothetical protein [Candidatus Nomurabacteria bacterium]USN87451.1 MAG: hypothetical protein H6779_03495 [Candidatus Nomurabacteria bacterium]